ncbi:MAG: Ycf48-like protein [Candidatus Binatia bacterium]|nr:MAG: Ycf48-like protein [Candidatus Binatia bacterium]
MKRRSLKHAGVGFAFLVPSIATWLVIAATPAAGTAPSRIVDNLYGTAFVSPDEGWAVGAFGSVYHTTDGGKTWNAQRSGTLEQLFGVAFANRHVGWVVGRTGVVLHTQDGGKTWVKQANLGKHLFHVAALDEQTAWAVGDWGAIFHTLDGGKSWRDRSFERDVILYSQSWPDPLYGWIVGETGVLLHTSDGGRTWQELDTGVGKTLFGVYFADRNQGWACGLDGLILHTTDGGRTWTVQRGDPEISGLEQVGVAEQLENASLYDIVVRGKMGFAVGDIGSIFFTSDGGQTWSRKQVPGNWRLGWIRSVSLVSNGAGMIVGAGGLTVRIDGQRLVKPEGQ